MKHKVAPDALALKTFNNTENDSFEVYKAHGEKGNPRGKKISAKDTQKDRPRNSTRLETKN